MVKWLALVIALGFAIIYVTGIRPDGGEVCGENGKKIWWNDLRPVHSLLYFAYFLSGRWELLALDTGVGVAAGFSKP